MSLKAENVWDYPRPPRLEPVMDRIRIIFGGATVADTVKAFRVLETSHPPTYYLPRGDIEIAALREVAGTSLCEWKGLARYFDVVSGSKTAPRAAWTYPDPTERFHTIRGHVAFYAEPMDACYVGDTQVLPQDGNFYGGWITGNLTGPFKGAPGTMGWRHPRTVTCTHDGILRSRKRDNPVRKVIHRADPPQKRVRNRIIQWIVGGRPRQDNSEKHRPHRGGSKSMIKRTLIAAILAASFGMSSVQAANIVETAQSAGSFNTLLAAAEAAGLVDALSGSGPLTVFAPTDEAFAALPEGTVDELLKPENRDQLVAALSYHVLPRELTSSMLPGRTIPVRTLNGGETLRVTKSHGAVTVDNATVVTADIATDNGVIHVIDEVLLPGTNTH